MKTHISRSEDAMFSIKYRAVCLENDYVGSWKPTEDEAIIDALAHQKSHGHHVDIEIKQTQLMRISITK